jgi:hypothetical protein
MLTPSPGIIALLSVFSSGMTAPTFRNALVLIYGTILAPGRRTVTAALSAMGVSEEPNFSKYHRGLNAARWSAMAMSRVLLELLILAFVPPGTPLEFLIDETLERRGGKKIAYKGWYRDAVRSTKTQVVVASGIRWGCVCLLVRVPWCSRKWALPVLTVPVLSEKTCKALGKPHRSGTWWAGHLIEKIRSWHPDREIHLTGDGGYASVDLIQTCRRLGVRFVCRLRIDANLYEFPGPQPPDKRGPKPKKGTPQPSFADRLADPNTEWTEATLPWYGGEEKNLAFCTGVSLWHKSGADPVPIRWVLVRYEETDPQTGKMETVEAAYLGSDPTVSAETILGQFVGRWNIETTFEEIRAYLGFETQRQWSQRAIERTAPALFGLFSLVVLMAHAVHPEQLPVRRTAWYPKPEATFSDALAAVRAHLWSALAAAAQPSLTIDPRLRKYTDSSPSDDLCLIPRLIWEHVQHVLSYAA